MGIAILLISLIIIFTISSILFMITDFNKRILGFSLSKIYLIISLLAMCNITYTVFRIFN